MTLPARGTPDWGAPSYEASAAQVDLGQVLSGLYHFDRVDQRGRVAIVETWGDGMNGWKLAATGGGAVPLAMLGSAGVAAFVPPAFAYFQAGGAAVGDISQCVRDIHLGSTKRIGMEIALNVQPAGGMAGYSEFSVDYLPANSGISGKMTLKYEPVFNRFSVLTTSGAQNILTTPLPPTTVWRQIKIVADWQTRKYIGAIIGDASYNFQQLGIADGLPNSALTPSGRCSFSLTNVCGLGAFADIMYVGYAVLTRDEP